MKIITICSDIFLHLEASLKDTLKININKVNNSNKGSSAKEVFTERFIEVSDLGRGPQREARNRNVY